MEADGIQLLRRVEGEEQAGAVTETEKKRQTILVGESSCWYIAYGEQPATVPFIYPFNALFFFKRLLITFSSRTYSHGRN